MRSTKASAYALGYLYAGASLHSDKICITGPRREDLEVICSLLNIDTDIKSSSEGKMNIVTFKDKRLYKKLQLIGLPPTRVPDMHHLKYFLSGYFDCRGGIFCDGTRRVISTISFKTFSMAQHFSQILSENGLREARVRIDSRAKSYYSLRYYIEDTEKLLDFLYNNSPLYNTYQRERYNNKLGGIEND